MARNIDTLRPLIEDWNGKAWKKVPFELPYGNTDGYLWGMAAIAADDVWAVGEAGNPVIILPGARTTAR